MIPCRPVTLERYGRTAAAMASSPQPRSRPHESVLKVSSTRPGKPPDREPDADPDHPESFGVNRYALVDRRPARGQFGEATTTRGETIANCSRLSIPEVHLSAVGHDRLTDSTRRRGRPLISIPQSQ